VDVAGAYLLADLDDFTLLKLEGESVTITCDVCNEYTKFVCYKQGKKALYLQLLKAGTVQVCENWLCSGKNYSWGHYREWVSN
jgi:hypothetical protein